MMKNAQNTALSVTGFDCFLVDLSDTDTLLTHILVWNPGEAHFRTYPGDPFDTPPPASALIPQWSRIGEVAEPGRETVRFDFSLSNGQVSLNGLERKMVIKNLGFEPL